MKLCFWQTLLDSIIILQVLLVVLYMSVYIILYHSFCFMFFNCLLSCGILVKDAF